VKTVPCDHCNGTGRIPVTADFEVTNQREAEAYLRRDEEIFCGSCMGRGTVQEDEPRPGQVEADIRRQGEEG
jgi:RecJ-like exonuclease